MTRVLTQFYSCSYLQNHDLLLIYAQLARYLWSIIMSPYATADVQDQVVLGNLCQHLYMDIRHFLFKAILLYSGIRFIEKHFAALTAKATSTTRKASGTIDGSKRSNNHEEK